MRLKFITLDNLRLLAQCRLGDRRSQRLLYEKYADLMLGQCRRYLSDIQEAEDAMMRGFVKVFTSLNKLKDDKKFEGWMRRIMVNECLMIIRKKKRMSFTEIEHVTLPDQQPGPVERISEQDILSLVDKLPDGYRTVFNMYVIEGYKHKEIAKTLGISVNTSKSQLIMARKKLREFLNSSGHLPSAQSINE